MSFGMPRPLPPYASTPWGKLEAFARRRSAALRIEHTPGDPKPWRTSVEWELDGVPLAAECTGETLASAALATVVEVRRAEGQEAA